MKAAYPRNLDHIHLVSDRVGSDTDRLLFTVLSSRVMVAITSSHIGTALKIIVDVAT